MNQKKQVGFRGPLVLAVGGTFIVFPLLSYAQLLHDGRLSFPYEGAAMGMTLYVCLFVFLGLLIAGMGLEMILEDSR
ncbi:MAG: hypothetical protein AM326_05720 [Candidatus Thorarchaeota archaeon SMTZ-45]|nr:MAG: hypothetical protein AM325_09350 [Candidatus Thorarchaeota archaeon SMTZ1-45]KXH77123.1 MAG: hypothetical protein AM326_05720 [Candidatus Thorarchaeota archaeon SMTZ-45]